MTEEDILRIVLLRTKAALRAAIVAEVAAVQRAQALKMRLEDAAAELERVLDSMRREELRGWGLKLARLREMLADPSSRQSRRR